MRERERKRGGRVGGGNLRAAYGELVKFASDCGKSRVIRGKNRCALKEMTSTCVH